MKEKLKKILKGLFCILSVVIIVILIKSNLTSENDIPLGFRCHYEEAVLLNQYIDSTNYTKGGDCSNGCLFMKVYTERVYFMPCGHVDKVEWKNKTYFFANEGLRTDLKKGDNIRVKWCYVNENIGKRIREVKKVI